MLYRVVLCCTDPTLLHQMTKVMCFKCVGRTQVKEHSTHALLICICSNVRQFSQLYSMHSSPMYLHVLEMAVFCQPQPLACMLRT